jgi:hypothetical protein
MGLLLNQVEYILHFFYIKSNSVISCVLTFLTVTDPTPAVSAERTATNLVADVQVPNPTVNGVTVENNPTAHGTIEKNVEPPMKVTKEDLKKMSVAVSSPPAQNDIPKKTPVAASPPPPPPAQKDVTKKTYASIVSSVFLFYFLVVSYGHVPNVIPKSKRLLLL